MNYYSYGTNRWKIVSGCMFEEEKRACELLYAAISAEVPYILISETTNQSKDNLSDNIVLLGTRDTNHYLADLVSESDVPVDGFFIKVMDSPYAFDKQVALVVGSNPTQTIYAASYFVSQYFPLARQTGDHKPYRQKLFNQKMLEYETTQVPAFEERGIWTWGHCIYDFQHFAENMARLGLNMITIWNDFAPLNFKRVIDCFHSYGIKVIFGFSWGWDEGVNIASEEELSFWSEEVVKKYETEYAHLNGDGIYFQSFTETTDEEINGISIAEAVVRWTNTISSALLEKWPQLNIQFGLHATSVKNSLDIISKVDQRINIVWEDCGAFPYAYLSRDTNDEETTISFTDKIASLRPGKQTFGVVLKGQMCLDWSMFEHQKGPFILGKQSRQKIDKRMKEVKPEWHDIQSYWFENYGQFRRVLPHLQGGTIYSLVEDGLLEENCWFPVALYALSLWKNNLSDEEMLQLVSQREDVVLA